MVFSVVLNALFPLTDPLLLELAKVLAEGVVKLLNILVLFSVVN